MNSPLIINFVVCAVLALVSIPLILKRVPPNRLYGVRTAKTLGDPTIWYKMNWFGGWAILVASLVGATSLALARQYEPGWLTQAGLFVMGPLVVALVAIWLYSIRIVDPTQRE